jgi:hypothetical protein
MTKNTQMNNNESRNQIAENMRFYADMRFKQLTLFVAWLTIAGAGVSQFGVNVFAEQTFNNIRVPLFIEGISVRIVIALSAVLFTAVMWVMEVRSTLNWVAHRQIVPDLWPRWESKWFRCVNATNAVLLLYVFVYFFWLWCAYAWQVFYLLTIAGIVLGLFLLLFSVTSYWPLWIYRELDSKC